MSGSEAVGAAAPPVQYRDVVEVGADGNGAGAGSFVAEASDRVRYAAVVRAGPEVGRLSVTLNDTVVLSWGDRRPRRCARSRRGRPGRRQPRGADRGRRRRLLGAPEDRRRADRAPRTGTAAGPPRFAAASRVGNDGNGASAGSFEAHGADRTRFAAVVVNGPVAVQAVSLTVNATAVLASETTFRSASRSPRGLSRTATTAWS